MLGECARGHRSELVEVREQRRIAIREPVAAPPRRVLDILVENSGRVNFNKVLRDERKGITDAVVKHFNTPADAVVVTIVESLKVNKAKAGVPFSEK